MQREVHHQVRPLERPCDICGDEGWKNCIATCSLGKAYCEHIYCMKINRTEVPENWVCEECITGTGCGGKEVGQGSSHPVHHNVVNQTACTNVCDEPVCTKRQKAVKTGKTKFLSEEEVKKLQSGSMNESCSKHKISGKFRSPVTSKFWPSRVNSIPEMICPGLIESLLHGKVQVNSVSDTRQPRTLEEKKPPAKEEQNPPARESGWTGKQVIPVKPCNEVNIGKMNVASKEGAIFRASADKAKNKSLYSSSASRHKVPISEREACLYRPATEVKTACADAQNVTKEAIPRDPPSIIRSDAISRSGVNSFLCGLSLDERDDQIQKVIPEFPSLPAPFITENSNDTNRSCSKTIESKQVPSFEKVVQKINTDLISVKGPLPSSIAEADIPWGSKETSRLNSANALSKGTVKETTHPFNGSVVQPVTPENTSPQSVKVDKDAFLQSWPIEVERELQQFDSGTNSTRWCPPPTDWVKLNVAGISKGPAGLTGAGGVIRDHSGKWVAGYSINLGTEKELRAVFWAVFEGLRLAWIRGFRKVVVECQSHVAIELLRRSPNAHDLNRALIDHCIKLMMLEWECKVEYVCKDANLCANQLATCFGGLPTELIVFDTAPDK